jgi:hypothetical protein
VDISQFHNQTSGKTLQNEARDLLKQCVDFGQTRTHGSDLFSTESNVLSRYLCNALLGKLLQEILQQHDNHVTHGEHFIQHDFQICNPSVLIFKELVKFLIDALFKINIT